MINKLPLYMLVSLTCTIIIELTIGIIVGIRDKKDILNIILVNLLTNPLLVSITYAVNIYYGLKVKYITIVILELLVIVIEGLIYFKNLKYKKINGFLISFILNIGSYFLGILINNFIW